MDGIAIVIVMLLAYRELKRLVSRFSAWVKKSNESRDNLIKSTDIANENNVVIADLQRQLIEALKENRSLKANYSTEEQSHSGEKEEKRYAFLKTPATIKKSNLETKTQH